MKNRLRLFIAAIAFVAISGTGAQAQQWNKVGEKMVGFAVDHDVIPVTAWKGAYTKVKFRCEKAPIYLHNINIIFGNGTNKNIKVGKRIAAGAESAVIDLPGGKRIIKKININYKSVPTFKGRARFIAYARR